MLLRRCLYFFFFCLNSQLNLVTSQSAIKNTSSKLGKEIKKIKPKKLANLKFYVGVSIGHAVSSRPSIDSYFTKIHKENRKKKFIENFSKITYELKNLDSKKTKIKLTNENAMKAWEYFSNVFLFSYVENNNIHFKVNLSAINNLSSHQPNNIDLILSLITVQRINNIFQYISYATDLDNSLYEFLSFTCGSHTATLMRGIGKYNDTPMCEDFNGEIFPVKKDGSSSKIEIESLKDLSENIKSFDDVYMSFLKNLIPMVDAKDIHYYLLDGELQLWHWKNHNFKENDYKKLSFEKVNNMENNSSKVIKKNKEQEKQEKIEKKEQEEQLNKEDKKKMKKKKEEKQDLKMQKKNSKEEEQETEVPEIISSEPVAKKIPILEYIDNPSQDKLKSNYLTFLLILCQKNNDKKAIENQEELVRKLQAELIEYNIYNTNTFNQLMFCLFGFHNKMNGQFGYLPNSYILKILEGNKDEKDIKSAMSVVNQDNGLKNSNYDLPIYDAVENGDLFKNSMNSLPELEDVTINQSFVGLSLLAMNDYLCGGIFLDFIVNTHKNKVIQQEFNRNYYMDFYGGIGFMKCLYVCGIISLMRSPQYFFSKLCDLGMGIGIIIKSEIEGLFMMVRFSFIWDINNNLFCFKFALNAYKCLNQNTSNNCDEDAATYIEYV
jgi:hypothetical protein